jgi:hypothetical protein
MSAEHSYAGSKEHRDIAAPRNPEPVTITRNRSF